MYIWANQVNLETGVIAREFKNGPATYNLYQCAALANGPYTEKGWEGQKTSITVLIGYHIELLFVSRHFA